jgi:hypothetical protein
LYNYKEISSWVGWVFLVLCSSEAKNLSFFILITREEYEKIIRNSQKIGKEKF